MWKRGIQGLIFGNGLPRLDPDDRRSPFEKAAGSTLPELNISPKQREINHGFIPEKELYEPKNPGDPRLTLTRAIGSWPKLPKTPREINADRGLTPETRKYR